MLTRNRLTSHSHSDSEQDAVISVGKDYQAKLPNMEKISASKYYSKKRKYEVVFWDHSHNISDEKLKDFITAAKINYNYTEEMVLGLIFWEKGNLEAVEKDFLSFVPKEEVWTVDEKIKLFIALDSCNKNFNTIKPLFPHKKIGQIVSAYYIFKKNASFLNELNYIGATMGGSIFSKIKKFETILPKHYLSKFGNILRYLPQSKTGVNISVGGFSPLTNWSDHPSAEALTNYIQQIHHYQNIYCANKSVDHELNVVDNFNKTRKFKKAHRCIYNHNKWLKDFYQAYDHDSILKQLKLSSEEREENILAEDQAIKDTTQVVSHLENSVMMRSKEQINCLRKWKMKLPVYNSKWTETDIELLQLAVNQCGGNISSISRLLGKTVNMIKHFVSLYSQRLHVDPEIIKQLLSGSK